MRTERTLIQAFRWGLAASFYVFAVLAFRAVVFNFSPDAREWNSITGYGGTPAPSEERGWFFLVLTVACINQRERFALVSEGEQGGMATTPKIATGNPGRRGQFRFAVHVFCCRVPELWTLGGFPRLWTFPIHH